MIKNGTKGNVTVNSNYMVDLPGLKVFNFGSDKVNIKVENPGTDISGVKSIEVTSMTETATPDSNSTMTVQLNQNSKK